MFKSLKCRIASACLFKLLSALIALSALLAVPAVQADQGFLEPGVAFRFSASMVDAKTAEVSYAIADGYYMYRERFAFKAEGAVLGAPVYPAPQVKFDDTFQKSVEIYHHRVTVRVPVTATGPFTLKVTGQGCAEKGLCYAPMESQVTLSPDGIAGMAASAAPDQPATVPAIDSRADIGGMGRIARALNSGSLLIILPLFLLLGLGLSLTPCVLPMVPILSAIIVGEGERTSRSRGFTLSAAYSIGMALVYTGLGIAAGLLGEGLAADLQNPWVLGAFALALAMLSLSMFGVYQLQMPAAVQGKLAAASDRQSAGRLFGVFIMGAIAALIVSPCVAAPLAGALLYISQTHDVVVGGSALFAMASGMSVPLLLVGLSAGTLLPRAGPWMQTVKTFFGVLMLALALWIVSPITPGRIAMAGWMALGIAYGGYLLWKPRSGWLAKAIGALFVVLGLVQAVGIATGAHDALAPLAHLFGSERKTEFRRVKSVAELDAAIAQAEGRMVMLDFYADWCVSCKEMERLTFSDPRVQARLAGMLLLQADVTANNDDDKTLLKRFGLFGPPGIIFFGRGGHEIQGQRVIGYQDSDEFLRSLDRAATFSLDSGRL